MTNIVFFGSSKYAAQCLAALLKDGRYDVKLVVTQPDAPSGRDQKITETAVAIAVGVGHARPAPDSIAGEARLAPTLAKPVTLSAANIMEKIKKIEPKIGVVLDYGLLIPNDILSLFDLGIINLHPSLLPRHRGAIPAQSAIIQGDKVTGVTLIKINEKFDSGEVLAQAEEEIKNDDTPPLLYDRLFTKGISLLLAVLPKYLAGEIKLKKQEASTEPYEKRLTKESGRIDWTQSEEVIERFIRGMHPWPGAWTTLSELTNKTNVGANHDSPSIKILKAHLTDSGTLSIDLLQIEGKKPISWDQFKTGYLK